MTEKSATLDATLRKREHFQRNGLVWTARAMDEQADALGSLPRECRLFATYADPRWNMLNQHAPAIDLQHFAYKLFPGGFAAADVAFES